VSTILIGVDSTARSEDAVALGRRLARAGTADVVVATVTSSEHPNRDEAHLTVRRMSGLLVGVDPGRIRTAVVAADSPANGLHQLAETESATLVVVGSTHTGPLGRIRPGSTGERLLHGSPCAVAVAPHGYRTEREHTMARIGAAWDGQPESAAPLAAAIGAARAFAASLQIVTVLVTEAIDAPSVLGAPSFASVRRDAKLSLERLLEETVNETAELVGTTGVVLDGHPWRELAAHSEQLDLLVVGSRGYGPAHAVIAGGTSGPLMQHAQCPVIVLPRGAEAAVVDVFEDAATPQADSRGFRAVTSGFPQHVGAQLRTSGELSAAGMAAVTNHRSTKE
jgi:nucleotide-binding universal stress UspA family protein